MPIYLKETMTAEHGYDIIYFAHGNGDWETGAIILQKLQGLGRFKYASNM